MALFGKRARPEPLPGGHPPAMAGRGLMFCSDPLPVEAHEQAGLAMGVATFAVQLLMSGGPVGSPLLNFKATQAAIWTMNPDGTLYERVGWDGLHGWRVAADDERVFIVRGLFVMTEFMELRLQPMAAYADALATLMTRKIG